MKLAHISLENPIDFKDDRIISWVIEDPKIYWVFIKELMSQIQGEIGDFVLSNKEKTLKLESDAQIVVGPFDISFESKKISTLITKKLLKTATEGDYFSKLQEIKNLTSSFLKELISDADLPVSIDDISDDNLIKSVEIKFPENKIFLENLCAYLSLILNLCTPKLLILVDVKRYLNHDELKELIKFLMYEDVDVLFVDLLIQNLSICSTRTYFMDSDRCEFELDEGYQIDFLSNDWLIGFVTI